MNAIMKLPMDNYQMGATPNQVDWLVSVWVLEFSLSAVLVDYNMQWSLNEVVLLHCRQRKNSNNSYWLLLYRMQDISKSWRTFLPSIHSIHSGQKMKPKSTIRWKTHRQRKTIKLGAKEVSRKKSRKPPGEHRKFRVSVRFVDVTVGVCGLIVLN